MTASKRILDMLPALLVFALVASFGTYIGIAYVVKDAFWIETVAELREEQAKQAVAPAPGASHRAGTAHR